MWEIDIYDRGADLVKESTGEVYQFNHIDTLLNQVNNKLKLAKRVITEGVRINDHQTPGVIANSHILNIKKSLELWRERLK